MNKVLILGGGGFIGAHLARELSDQGYEVYVYDFNIQYFSPVAGYGVSSLKHRQDVLLAGVKLIRGNTEDVNGLRRTILSIEPKYIVNLAAMPLATTAVHYTEEAFSSILVGTKNVLEILRDIHFVNRFIHISSSMIYGDFESEPNPETAKKEPKEIYGSMKLASEYIVKGYSMRHNIPFSIIRPSAVYGPTDTNRRVLQAFIEKAIRGEPINVHNPDSNKLDFTYVTDTAKGIVGVLQSDKAKNEDFNITRGEGRLLGEAVEIIRNYFPKLQVNVSSEATIHPRRGALDIEKARNLAGYKPEISLEEGIQKYIEFIEAGL